MGILGGLLSAAASIVVIWYLWSVLRDASSSTRRKWMGNKVDATSALLMGRAANLAATEGRLAASLEARQVRPIFEVLRTISRVPGREIVLTRNVGGIASNVQAQTSEPITVDVHPKSFGPEDEVQFTITNISEGFSTVEIELGFTNSAGAPETHRFQYDKASSTIREL